MSIFLEKIHAIGLVSSDFLYERKLYKEHEERYRFEVRPYSNGIFLSKFFEGRKQEDFISILGLAKEFVQQYTTKYIQEDVFMEFKSNMGLTLTLSSPGFPGVFIVRLPVFMKTEDNVSTYSGQVIRNRHYRVEYLAKGIKDTKPVIAGSFFFEG